MTVKERARTPLESELAAMIASEGPITLERYMALCLGHPRHGYYMTRDPFGTAGDFVTAPEISQIFGELIGLWCAHAWQKMKAPTIVRLIEPGPGRGTLMVDMLRAARAVPGFLDALDVHLIETSPTLREIQKKRLADALCPVSWHEQIETVPAGSTLLVANEFFDALPVRQFVFSGGAWRERLVGLNAEGTLTLGLSPHPIPQGAMVEPDQPFHEGTVLEQAPAREAVVFSIAERLAAAPGAALIIDYGHMKTAFGDTVQAMRGHAFAPILETPGHCDLTSHVDFEALARGFTTAGARVLGPMEQGTFLSALGLHLRAEALKRNADEGQANDIDAGVARLTGDDAMGRLFKVLAATGKDMPALDPFRDRRT